MNTLAIVWKKKLIRRVIHRLSVIVSYERSPEMSTDKSWRQTVLSDNERKKEQVSVYVHAPMRVKPLIRPDRSPLKINKFAFTHLPFPICKSPEKRKY